MGHRLRIELTTPMLRQFGWFYDRSTHVALFNVEFFTVLPVIIEPTTQCNRLGWLFLHYVNIFRLIQCQLLYGATSEGRTQYFLLDLFDFTIYQSLLGSFNVESFMELLQRIEFTTYQVIVDFTTFQLWSNFVIGTQWGSNSLLRMLGLVGFTTFQTLSDYVMTNFVWRSR